MTLRRILPVLAIMVSACGAEEGFELSNSLDDGKSDSLDGKRLEPVISKDVPVTIGYIHKDNFVVETIGSRIVEVTGPQMIYRAEPDERVRFRVETPDFFTELRFIARVRPADSEADWQVISFDGTVSFLGSQREITVNYFDLLELDAGAEEVSFEFEGDLFTRPYRGVRGVALEYSVFVFPASGWGSLAGDYEFELTTD